MDLNVLPAILRLQELTHLNICVIFLSSIVWEKFYLRTGLLEPLKVFFPQYNKGELIKILHLDRPSEWDPEFHLNYLNLFYCVVGRSCRDLGELRYMARRNFEQYCKPVANGDIDKTDAKKLWQHISPHLKLSLRELYLRVAERGSTESRENVLKEIIHTDKCALSFELPYYTKYFLIAAYLASYNPASTDKRLFVKHHGKQKKKKFWEKRKRVDIHLLGPKAFTIERLLAIFYAILEEKVGLTINLLAQVSTLVKLQLLTSVGEDSIGAPRYKCVVGLDFIRIIAKTVDFNIVKYLYDLQ